MKIRLLLVLLLLIPKLFYSQDFSDSWTGHFSYLDIKDVSLGSSKVFGAAENAIFIYDINTNGIEKLSTIHGLSGETISSIHYVEESGLLLIGFVNGLIQVYIESDKDFITVVDILNKPTIPPNEKKINHFNIYNGFAYVSTDYGVSLYDIENLEFGDTYFIGAGGSQVKVSQTTVFEGYIYAASNVRLHRALVDDTDLIDFQEWEDLAVGNWFGIQKVEDILYAASTNKRVYEVVDTSITEQIVYPDNINSFNNVEDKLVVTTNNIAKVYTQGFTEITSATINADYDAKISTATISIDEHLYIGTTGDLNMGKPGLGILKTAFDEPTVFEDIHPSCPLLNSFFQVRTQEGQIWGTHGGHSVSYNPYGGIRRTGLSHFKEDEWHNIPYDSIANTVTNPWALSYLSINPFNTNEVYVSSSISGLIYIENDEVNTWYNQDNSTIIPFLGSNYFLFASNFDNDGALWLLNGRVDTGLNRFKDGQWSSFSLSDIIQPATSNLGYSSIAISEQGDVFMGSHNYGLIGFNENNGSPILQNVDGEEDNMPSKSVKCVALDRQNQLWVGTDKGLRVVYNPSSFINETPEVDDIIILDDGIARELLFQQYITDIEVDGSNNKWIATLDTGLYYFSSDGQETIFHFTKDNSPLPTNNVLDVALDEVNGVVYIATDKGLISFKSNTSKPQKTLEDAYVYPNPVRPTFNITQDKVKIKGLTDNVNIKITDIEGNLVTEAESRINSRFKGYNLEVDGGTALWNGKNLSGRVVASGVYIILISDLDSLETKVLKVMIVR